MLGGKELIDAIEEAAAELLDERGFLFQRSSDRYKAIFWMIRLMKSGEIPSKMAIKDAILIGED